MSIINEALKKVQTELLSKGDKAVPEKETQENKPPESNPPAPPTPPPPSAQRPQPIIPLQPLPPAPITARKQERMIIISAILGSLAILCAVIILFNYISADIFRKKRARYVLKGIIQKNNKSMALINDDIYEAGEVLDGMKIERITLDQVDVVYRGRRYSFKVYRKK